MIKGTSVCPCLESCLRSKKEFHLARASNNKAGTTKKEIGQYKF